MIQNVGDINNSNVKNVNVNKGNTFNNHPKQSMCGCFNALLMIANVTILAINLFFICNYYPRIENLEFDYIGIIVSILSLLITVLIGWQIFSHISIFNEVKNKIDNLEERTKGIVSKITLDAKHSSIAVSFAQQGVSQFYKKDYDNSTRTLFNALVFCQKINSKDELYYETYDNVIETIVKLSNISSGCQFDSQEEIELFQEAAFKTGNKEVIAFAMKFKSNAEQ